MSAAIATLFCLLSPPESCMADSPTFWHSLNAFLFLILALQNYTSYKSVGNTFPMLFHFLHIFKKIVNLKYSQSNSTRKISFYLSSESLSTSCPLTIYKYNFSKIYL